MGGAKRQKDIIFKQINMYNRTNPAVIKSIFLRLTRNELIQEIQTTKSILEEQEPGTKREMLINLYQFAMDQLPKAKNTSYKL